ncbi:MAG: lysophospholipid acyltransferase family protein [Acidobacteriota bacterium]
MKNAPVRHRLESFVYRGVKAFLGGLPPRRVRAFGRRLGSFAARLLRSRRRLAEGNLALAFPELAEERRRELSAECFRHLGAGLCESLAADRWSLEEIEERFEVVGWAHAEAALAAGRDVGRGLFLMTGHFGPWELATHLLGLRFGGIDFVARPPDNPWIAADVQRMRERSDCRTILKRGAAFGMMKAIRRGRAVGFLIDQRVPSKDGILVPFFGHDAWTSPALAHLSLRTGAAVLPLFCHPVAPDRYRLEFKEPLFPPQEAPSETLVAELTTRYAAIVEDEVRRHPALWLWLHRRWKR